MSGTTVGFTGGFALRALEEVLLGERSGSEAEARERLSRELPRPTAAQVWLALAALRAELPGPDEVIAWRRRCDLDGFAALLRMRVATPRTQRQILVGQVLVDAHHTIAAGLATGIQRVARKVLEHWSGRRFVLTGWSRDYRALVRATADGAGRKASSAVAIPWQSTYVLLELATEPARVERMHALAEFSGNGTGVVGMDCVPLTAAETAGPGMPAAFARNLAALARFDRLAGISDAATSEYAGWKRMISSAGLTGPQLRTVALAQEQVATRAAGPDAADDVPLVLVVGSHEPRKNHGAVLHAAELLWRRGERFRLLFVGGNSWNTRHFDRQLDRLRAAGRSVEQEFKIDDERLDTLYRSARVTVFPSLHEGFGLPIVESLAVGTPVITSDYGSMRQLGVPGSLLVDPRDDHAIAAALGSVLGDDETWERLRNEATSRPHRSWEAYADELWSFLVDADR